LTKYIRVTCVWQLLRYHLYKLYNFIKILSTLILKYLTIITVVRTRKTYSVSRVTCRVNRWVSLTSRAVSVPKWRSIRTNNETVLYFLLVISMWTVSTSVAIYCREGGNVLKNTYIENNIFPFVKTPHTVPEFIRHVL